MDPFVADTLLLNEWWYYLDNEHRIYKWITNSQFVLLVNTLCGGNDFLNNTKLCWHCGHIRSWLHNCVQCPSLENNEEKQVDLKKMFEGKHEAKVEVAKLCKLVVSHKKRKQIPNFMGKGRVR